MLNCADVVAPDDQDVGLLLLRLCLGKTDHGECPRQGNDTKDEHPTAHIPHPLA